MHSASVVVFLARVLLLVTPLMANETDPQSKIVGGEAVDIADFPFQVSVQIKEKHNCGASIIDKEFVLTAAHCCEGKEAGDLQLKVGNTEVADGVKYLVEKILKHPKYNDAFDYDICVIKVTKPFELNDKVAIITMAPEGTTIANGTNVTVSGWGRLQELGEYPSTLQAVDLPYLDHKTCAEIIANSDYNYFAITDRMICTKDPNHIKDSCQGDSGGPLVADVNGTRLLIGVNSWGIGCAEKDEYPGVHESVANLHSWIMDTMANN